MRPATRAPATGRFVNGRSRTVQRQVQIAAAQPRSAILRVGLIPHQAAAQFRITLRGVAVEREQAMHRMFQGGDALAGAVDDLGIGDVDLSICGRLLIDDVGKRPPSIDAETAPLRDPRHYQYDLNLRDITEVWRRGSVIASWLLDLTATALADLERAESYPVFWAVWWVGDAMGDLLIVPLICVWAWPWRLSRRPLQPKLWRPS